MRMHFVVILLLLLDYNKLTSCELVLTPSNLVSVCSGEQLSLACSTDQSNYLQWTTLLPDIYSINGAIVRTIAKDFRTGQAGLAVEIDSTTDIRFFKNSAVNALPLRSTLQVNNVPAAFNGTRISCTEYGTTGLTSAVTISVLDINQFEGSRNPPVIQAKPDSEEFSSSNVTVVIEVTNETRPEASYFVNVLPNNMEKMQFIEPEDVETQLTVSVLYNIQYYVSVTATICGHRYESSNTIALYYAKCHYPLVSQNVTIEDYNYSQLAIEGNYITFGCSSSAFILIGPNTSTCMGNGQWEPDPRETECKITCGSPPPPSSGYIFSYSGILEGATVLFMCNSTSGPNENYKTAICNQSGKWEPNPRQGCKTTSNLENPYATFNRHNYNTLMIVGVIIILVLAVMFVVVFVCIAGCFIKKRNAKKVSIASNFDSAVAPIYEEILPSPLYHHPADIKDEDPQVKENMAYGPCTMTCIRIPNCHMSLYNE